MTTKFALFASIVAVVLGSDTAASAAECKNPKANCKAFAPIHIVVGETTFYYKATPRITAGSSFSSFPAGKPPINKNAPVGRRDHY